MESVGIAVFFIPYQLAMIYSMFMLASFWAGRKLRGVPDLVYMIFGVLGPLVGWLLSTLVPSFGFVIPASLAVVYWWASSHEAVEESVVAGEPARERAQALAELERDPRNAAAHWAIARSYESEKKFDLALEHYERAHGIDERTMPRQELDDARDRLSAAAVPDTANPHLEEQVRADARRARWERRILYFSLLLILVNRAWAANLCATMLFLGWFSPIKRNC